ncbi:MAG: GGDEF domain-containing protein [Xanthobacteraceae bacterium]|jgi:diguanylate cyclase (GGDEF)-like protein
MPQEKPIIKGLEREKPAGAAPRKIAQARPLEAQGEPSWLAAEIERLRAELQRSEALIEALEKSAHEDALTGLLNRRGFARAFAQAIAYLKRYGGSAALLYLDLDRFKPVNDRYGHAAGDVVLRQIAGILQGSVRASDLAARLGGDELALVLWNLDALQMQAKMRALEALVDGTSFSVGGEQIDLGVSIGGTMLLSQDDLDSALARADAAMYARKQERRNNPVIPGRE